MPDPTWSPDGLAARVADGEKVEWEEILKSASDEGQRRLIRHLRLVESVARVHRSPGSPASPVPAPSTMMETMETPRGVDPVPPKASWGHLELRESLGRGAFGEVYRAWDRRLDREVALKLLKAGAPVSTTVEEGRLLARLRHPSVVTVFGAEEHGGRVGLWMELIRGRSLEQLLDDRGPFGAREAALVGIDLCRALAAVHGAGLVHRDVKAQNVMREEGGRILLTDFGAGIDVRGRQGDGASISGTPFYMAPELFVGASATPRSDLYSLGVLLYRLVTGAFPVEAETWNELVDKHALHDVKLLRDRRSDLPEGFVAVVERALARNPDDRFATAGGMEHALSLTLGAATEQTQAAGRKRGAGLFRGWGPVKLSVAAGLAVVAIALATTVAISWRGASSRGRSPAQDGVALPPTDVAGLPKTSVAPPYTVEASLHRVRAHSSVRERVEPGSRLALGDSLTLEFKSSAPLHVYVIDEDEAGHAYALFPLPGFDPQNPLPAGSVHVLPGSRDGKQLSWSVNTAGGREHLLVLASPNRLVEFEAEMNALARPGQTAVSIPESATVRLRGLGGLAETPEASGGKPATHLFEMAQHLASSSETVTGIWMRRIDLENPTH